MPNDTTFYDYGWYDRHHAGGPGCYHDNLYWGKDNYHRFSDHKDEIIYWGEDGAIGTPRVFSSFGMKSCNLALLLDGKRWII